MTLSSRTLYARWPHSDAGDDHDWLTEARDHVNMANSIVELLGVASGNPDSVPESSSIEFACDAAMAAMSDAKYCLEIIENGRRAGSPTPEPDAEAAGGDDVPVTSVLDGVSGKLDQRKAEVTSVRATFRE